MAQLAAREMQVVAGEDHAVGVRKDVYVDTERGVALQVENVALAVDLGDGRIGVAHHERIVGAVAVQAPEQQSYPSYPPPANPYYNNAPPPYYPQQLPPQPPPQRQDVNVVVTNEPRVVHVHHNQGTSDYGNGAMIFAVMATFCILFFGCWWSLICTFAAIFLAASATSAGSRGDFSSARSNSNVSIGCTVTGIVSTVIGLVVLFGIVFGNASSASSS